MQLTKLKIVGFKSFVEPTEVPIAPGLTGVVGPNGCGKSNLVEALRWVMGESSYKSMRASGMDDVIFSGSGARPARNTAEVALSIDNSDRRAPAAFNETEQLEVMRRIEREAGSVYKVNGREVRARDVQLLFADAATGARSPSMVRQGQIGEIISAKPQARRRILEDAAGIAGLHARRHEAELRLKGAEENIVRLEDVLAEIEAQRERLDRQAKQASRYRVLSADLRQAEALHMLAQYRAAQVQLADAERALDAATRLVAERTSRQAEAAKLQAIAAAALPALRETEVAAAATLQRLTLARRALDDEERRINERIAELERRQTEFQRDSEREETNAADAATTLDRLKGEADALAHADEGSDLVRAEAEKLLAERRATLATAEAAFAEIEGQLAERRARRAAAEQTLASERQRLERLQDERGRVSAEIAEMDAATRGEDADSLQAGLANAQAAMQAAEKQLEDLRFALVSLRARENELRGPLAEADRAVQRLETEARTLRKLLTAGTGDLWPPVVDAVKVRKGFETALGAALGDDLEASLETSAPAHWRALAATGDERALPDGVASLLDVVEAPAALARALAQIGLVERARGAKLQALLRPGQRLVSREGDLWRWDGLTTAAEAPSAAARRLAEKNRLADIDDEATAARGRAESLRGEREAVETAIRKGSADETAAQEAARQARRALDAAREKLAAHERRQAQTRSRRAVLDEATTRLESDVSEASRRVEAFAADREACGRSEAMENERASRQEDLAAKRSAESEARATVQSLARDAALRQERGAAIARDRQAWSERLERAARQREEIERRGQSNRAERTALDDAPGAIILKRRGLTGEIETAEAKRREAADRLAEGETALAAADRAAREALQAHSDSREGYARAETLLETAHMRDAETEAHIQETFECAPAGLQALAQIEPGAAMPSHDVVEKRLHGLRAERDRMGPVNLQAESELQEAIGKRDKLVAERDDLTEAIKRLRTAIQSLNREGRERLIASFETVNEHFKRIFITLFGGGAAELQLVESEDPLESGLEIMARPPGKKPQTMTLLSGGEQALTAIALIFAVFLTNPSPICVLDEVDAPLDDANVERYCDLLAEMTQTTETRFLVITHNPITMARMDRLFGVTMAERGVSQLVSVDLETAEQVAEAS